METNKHTPGTVPPCGHTEGPHHDCAYVDARNSLLAGAERVFPKGGAAFFIEMDRRAIAARIMEPPGPWLAEEKLRDAEERARSQRPLSGGDFGLPRGRTTRADGAS